MTSAFSQISSKLSDDSLKMKTIQTVVTASSEGDINDALEAFSNRCQRRL